MYYLYDLYTISLVIDVVSLQNKIRTYKMHIQTKVYTQKTVYTIKFIYSHALNIDKLCSIQLTIQYTLHYIYIYIDLHQLSLSCYMRVIAATTEHWIQITTTTTIIIIIIIIIVTIIDIGKVIGIQFRSTSIPKRRLIFKTLVMAFIFQLYRFF